MKEISQRIELIRKCLRKTIDEFSCDISVTPELVNKWENNCLTPSLEDILKISRVYKISTEYIINGNANNDDKKILERKLLKDDLIDEIKQYLLKELRCEQSIKRIEDIVKISLLEDEIDVRDMDIANNLYFNTQDVINLADFSVYKDIKNSFYMEGVLQFKMLNPQKHSLDFYGEALKTDKQNIENTFLKYTSDESLWNDEVILWLLNNGAVCMEFTGINERDLGYYMPDGFVHDRKYTPLYGKNLVQTFLLKTELERKLRK